MATDHSESDTSDAWLCTSYMISYPRGHNLPLTLAYPPDLERPSGPKRLLHMTSRLGLPIYTCDAPELPDHAKAIFTADPDVFAVPDNPILQHLSIKKSPATHTILCERKPGNFMLARADGKDLETAHVLGLWNFIDFASQEVMTQDTTSKLLGTPITVSSHDRFHALMTPENFVGWWKRHNAESTTVKFECPVKLDCKACCKADGEGKDRLMRCGKCGVVRYCGQECQRIDWATHKKVCVK